MVSNKWKKKLYMPKQNGVFALSRSKIDLFLQCPKCFYFDRVFGISRPACPAFLINSAIDKLLKKEFDIYRSKKEAHPIMEKNNIDALLFEYPDLDNWRNNFTGIRVMHPETNFEIFGAVDDIWINSSGELHVVDYKSTSTDESITLDCRWKESYKRQIEIYQWLLTQKGFLVSNIGYFVYANTKKDKEYFEEKLEFDTTLLQYDGSINWVDDTLIKIKEILDSNTVPQSSLECEYCRYIIARSSIDSQEDDLIIEI